MRPSHATSKKRCYRYYVTADLVEGNVGSGAKGWRIPAGEIEAALARMLVAKLREPDVQSAALRYHAATPELSAAIVQGLADLADRLAAPESVACREALRSLIVRVDLSRDALRAQVSLAGSGEMQMRGSVVAIPDLPVMEIEAPLRLQRRGPELRIVLGGAAAARKPDPVLLRTLIDARRRATLYLAATPGETISDLARREGTDVSDVSRSLQLAFLAPDLVQAILDGTQPLALTAERLKRIGELPLLWDEQRALLA